MSASPTRPAESGTGAVLERGLDTSSGLDFVRERLALVGKTLFLVSFGFYLFLLASMVLVGGAPFVAVVTRAGRARPPRASWTMGLLWLLASRARLSLRSLGALDAVSIRRGRRFPLPHDDEGRGADPPGAAGPHGHRHDPRDPGALPAGPDHGALGAGLRSRPWSSASRAITPRRSCPDSARAIRSCT